MKKIILLLSLVLSASISLCAQINALSIPDATIAAGKSIDLPIMLDNSADVVAVQFNIQLPNGFSFTTNRAALTERTEGFSVRIKQMTNQNYLVVLYSPTNQPIKARTGAIFTVPLVAASTLKDSTVHTPVLSNVIIGAPDASNIFTNCQAGSFTISASADIMVSDVTINTATITPKDTVNITYTITNVSAADIPATGWTEYIYLENEQGKHKCIATLHQQTTLQQNQTITRNVQVAVPDILTLHGTAHVRVKVVANKATAEPSWHRANNEATTANNIQLNQLLYISPDCTSIEESDYHHRFLLSRSGNTESEQQFTITPVADTRFTLPETVTIPAKQSSAYFWVSITANGVIDNDTIAHIHISGNDYPAATATILIDDDTYPQLTITADQTHLQEGSSTQLTITTQRPLTSDLFVYLTADANVFELPSSLRIPAGQTAINLSIPTIDDDVPNPEQQVTITASAAKHQPANALLTIEDNDIPDLQLTLTPNAISESAGPLALNAQITRTTNINNAITIRLSDDSEGEIYYGNREVQMSAGQSEVNINLGPIDNSLVDGERTYHITAAVYSQSCACNATIGSTLGIATAPLTIYDNDGPTLTATTSTSVLPEDGTLSITVTRNTATNQPLSIAVTSDHDAQLDYPSSVTIPVGKASTTFSVSARGNAVNGDDYTAILTLTADGYAKANAWFMVSDQTLPDAQITALSVPSNEVLPLDTIPVTITIHNTGNYILPERTKVNLYLANNPLHTLVLPAAIAAGDSTTITSKVVIPNSVGGIQLHATINQDKAVSELSYTNNTSPLVSLVILSPFTFTINTNAPTYHPGDTVVISGQLYAKNVAQQPIELYVINNGVRQPIMLTTKNDGTFSTNYIPLPGQIGHFTVGACFPNEKLRDQLASFDIYGLKRTSNTAITCETYPSEIYTGSFNIINPTHLPLSNVQVRVVSKPEHCQVELNCPNTILAEQTISIDYSITSNAITDGQDWEHIVLEITTEQNISLRVTLYHYCFSHLAQLKANIQNIRTTMTMDTVRAYSFMISNIGKGETGPISLQLPSWMGCYTPLQMPSLASGSSAEVMLKLQPTNNMPLNIPVMGTIGINCTNGNGLALPYSIEPVSETTGMLIIDVCDENTYYTAEAPHLQGAEVTISHPTKGTMIAKGITDANGLFTVELPEGYYSIYIRADQHEEYRNRLLIDPGVENRHTINLSINGVSVTWDVTETEVEDEYEITTNVEFETNVPIPVVTLSMPKSIPAMELQQDESLIFNAVLTNKGLITAEDVELLLPTGFTTLSFEALSNTEPFDLVPQQSVSIPVKVTKIQTTSPTYLRGKEKVKPIDNDPCVGEPGTLYFWDCGLDRKWHRYGIALQLGSCNSNDSTTWGPSDPKDPTNPNTPNIPSIPITPGNPERPILEVVPHTGFGYIEPVVAPWFGGGGTMDCEPCQNTKLLLLIKCGLSFTPVVGTLIEAIELCIALKDLVMAIMKGEFASHSIWDILTEPSLRTLKMGLLMKLEETASTLADKIGKVDNILSCISDQLAPCDKEGTRLGKKNTYGYVSEPSYMQEFQKWALVAYDELQAYRNVFVEYFGDETWLYVEDGDRLQMLISVMQEHDDILLPVQDYLSYKPMSITEEQFETFINRWNNTILIDQGEEISSVNYIDWNKIINCFKIIEYCEETCIQAGYNSTSEMWEVEYKKYITALSESSSSVCSTISLQLSQTMTFTRQAFLGKLSVFNGSEDTPMRDIRLTLKVTDEDGNMATDHEFQINMKSLEGFGGDNNLNAAWTLNAQQTGDAIIEFIPTKFAAPMVERVYNFGGTLSYIDPFTGLEVTRILNPVSLTVKPSPQLDLTYFMQRDIYGDDPLTEPVEPSLPAEFSLLIHNVGYGDANNVSMTTNQPKIQDNEKGLLIDFEILSTQLNGQEKSLALGEMVPTDFGTIPAQSTAYAQWWLRSSLLGHFTEYKVEANHVSSYGNENLSLLNNVTIHELIRSIDASSTNENLVGFMTNDIADANDLPDMMYLSNGMIEEVTIAQSANMTKLSDTEYILTIVPSQIGWNYGSIADPTYGNSQLSTVNCQRDGKSISLRNIWQTDRTLRDGNDPLYENRIHFVDNFATQSSETYTLTFEAVPIQFLQIEAFEGVPNENQILTAPLNQLSVRFCKPIDPATFTAEDITLTVQGKQCDITALDITTTDNQTFQLDLSNIDDNLQDGYHVLSIQTATITDAEGFSGREGATTAWNMYAEKSITILTSANPIHAGTVKCTYEDNQHNTIVANQVDYGQTITLTATPAEGYDFLNWTINNIPYGTNPTIEYLVLDETNVVANFTEKMYEITINSDIEGGTIQGAMSGIYPYGTLLYLSPQADYDFAFSHWIINGEEHSDKASLTISVNQPLTISAHFNRVLFNQRLALVQEGWHWVSTYLQEPVPIEEFTDISSHILSQLDEVIKDPIFGFVGGITELEAGVAYKIQTPIAFARQLQGQLYNPQLAPITLRQGWNWIGYPYYEDRLLEAITNPSEGDNITAQDGFASFEDGCWQGNITSLTPGMGYLYKSVDNKQLQFNFTSTTPPANVRKLPTHATDDDITVNIHQYPNTMNVTAQLYRGNVLLNDDDLTVYAMAGNECRGIAQQVGDYYYITIYGDKIVDISFLIRNNRTGETYIAQDILPFNGDIVGSRSLPYHIHLAANMPTAIDVSNHDTRPLTIHTILGVLIKSNATIHDLQALPAGIYIVGGQKYYVN